MSYRVTLYRNGQFRTERTNNLSVLDAFVAAGWSVAAVNIGGGK